MISTILFGLGVPCCCAYVAIAMRASGSVTARYARIRQSTRFAVSFTSVTTGGSFMVRALSMGGWLDFHSRKVPRTACRAVAATKSVAQGVA